jgi:hypothetical protein
MTPLDQSDVPRAELLSELQKTSVEFRGGEARRVGHVLRNAAERCDHLAETLKAAGERKTPSSLREHAEQARILARAVTKP